MQQLCSLPVHPRERRTFVASLVAWLVCMLLMIFVSDVGYWFLNIHCTTMGIEVAPFVHIAMAVFTVVIFELSNVLLTVADGRIAVEFNRQKSTLLFVCFVLLIVCIWLAGGLDAFYLLAILHVFDDPDYDTLNYVGTGISIFNCLALYLAGTVMTLRCGAQLRTAGMLLLLSMLFAVMNIVFFRTVGKELFMSQSYTVYYMTGLVLNTARYVLMFMGLNKIITAR